MSKIASALALLAVFLGILLGAVPLRAQTLNGLWRSDGYGLLLEVQGNTIKAFEVTSISCIPSWQAEGKTIGANEITFMHDSCDRRLALDNSPDAARLHADCSSADILFRRIQEQPKGYGEKPDNTPQNNYAVFQKTYAENYPFFDLHHVDWTGVDAKFRPQITAGMRPEELFRILRQMIEPLDDAHTSITAGDIKQQYRGSRPDGNKLAYNDYKRALEIVAFKYLHDIRYFCKNQVWFGMMDGSIGYLNIGQFIGYTDEENYAAQLQSLEAALDSIFADSQKLHGLVIDVRLNGGGYSGFGISVASRLTRQDYLAYSVQTRDNADGLLHFTPPQSVQVPASTRPGFQGRVVLLIGRNCISAGETFTMALFGRKPTVMRIGENTQGVYSDVQTRKLPNGWTFGLPNQIYLTDGGKAFDGAGIPPDIALPVFPREDLQAGRDSVIEKALDVLGRNTGP